MKFLIVLLAVVALAKADGTAASFQACVDETIQFKGCIFKEVANHSKQFVDELKAFGQEAMKCFQADGVKDICKPPSFPKPPPHPQGPPPQAQAHSMPAPPPEFAQCFDGAGKAFSTCFKKGAGIPDDFTPKGLPEPPKPGSALPGPPPPMMHGQFHESPEEAKKLALGACGGNQDAADKLFKCAADAAKPHLKALIAISNPLIGLCQAEGVCQKQKPISSDCQAKLDQGKKALCDCRDSFPKFLKEDAQCATVREAFAKRGPGNTDAAQAPEARPAENAVAAHHPIPQHPDHPVDVCAQQNICQELRDKFEKARAAYGAKPAQ